MEVYSMVNYQPGKGMDTFMDIYFFQEIKA
jgi:hypothetical protein